MINDLIYQISKWQKNVNVMTPYHHYQVSNWRCKVSLSSKEKDRIGGGVKRNRRA